MMQQNADAPFAVEFRGVFKSFGAQTVLQDFSLCVPRGSFLVMIGSSGCGKTTALKMVNGLVLPDRGTVHVDGVNVAETDGVTLRRNIGYSIQGVGLFPHMTVRKNIAYVPELLNGNDRAHTARAVERLIATVGLEHDMLDRFPHELSGGQQQRVGIARALAAGPDLLLMDEPFGAVDEITRGMLQNELARIHRELGITVIFITHDIREALKLGTQVLVMQQGGIAQQGTPAEIAARPATDFVRQLLSCAHTDFPLS